MMKLIILIPCFRSAVINYRLPAWMFWNAWKEAKGENSSSYQIIQVQPRHLDGFNNNDTQKIKNV